MHPLCWWLVFLQWKGIPSSSTYNTKRGWCLYQAAHLTGGLYIRPTDRCTALQYLVHCLSADTETRKMLVVHQPLGVDFRASCFCHKKTIDIGYVCSVCLSIFCEKVGYVCSICLSIVCEKVCSVCLFIFCEKVGYGGYICLSIVCEKVGNVCSFWSLWRASWVVTNFTSHLQVSSCKICGTEFHTDKTH
jgi:hypothetical protein